MTAYATSGDFNYARTRDQIILRALRLIGAIGSGETAAQNATAVTEAAEALNVLCLEWQTDGMPLWAIREYVIRPYASVKSYAIADGPLKVIQAWRRDSSTTPNPDTPLLVITREEYQRLSAKDSTGTPSQVWYDPPGNYNQVGTATFFVAPDSNSVTYHTFYLVGQRPFEVFDASTDVPDFPKYWYNALAWGLADQLAYEYGVGVTEKAQITKKAESHKQKALDFGLEEGSIYFQPTPRWEHGV